MLIVALTVPLFISLLRPGFFPMQDDLQAFRVQQMVKCLHDFQIPCRWIPDMGYGYGYPQFNFYPPSVFYLGGVLNILGIQVIDAVKILFILGFVLSALTMFIFLKALLNRWSAFIGAILYSYVPYKATEVYVRGSLSEFWAFVFFPLIFWSSLRLVKTGKLKYVSWLAISISLLLTTHNLMSFIFLPISIIWIFTLTIVFGKWKIFPRLILGLILGLGLAAFFTIPVIFEGKFVHLETLTGGYFGWRQHFVTLNQLFLSNYFGYGSSVLGPNDDLSFSTGIIHWILGLLGVVLTLFSIKKFKLNLVVSILIMAGLELIVLFMMHQKSSFLWEKIPGFPFLQFPWRFLSDSTFILSFLGACSIYIVGSLSKNFSRILGVGIIIGLYILSGSFFQPKSWLNISDLDKFSGQSWEKQLTISIFDYLPIYAKFPPTQKAPDYPEILKGKGVFKEYKKGSDYQTGLINVDQEVTLRAPLYDFPGMKVLIDGGETTHWNNECSGEKFCLGLITFKVPEGKHIIRIQLEDTLVRRIGNILTMLSSILVVALFLKHEKEIV